MADNRQNILDNVLKKGKEVLNEGIDTYKDAETFKAIKEKAPIIILVLVAVVFATYFITKKMK